MFIKFFTPKTTAIILITALITLTTIIFIQYQQAQREIKRLKADPNFASQRAKEETQKVIEEVGKLLVLPKDETPTIATVTDVDKLKTTQSFFTNAKNGDKVLIYSKKAILYDPVAKKIIDIAPINVVSPSPSLSNLTPTPPITPKPLITLTPIISQTKFYLLNGTKVTGLTRKYEPILKQSLPTATVIDRDNAKKKDYQKTILVDVNGAKPKEAEQVAKTLNLSLEKLPEGEDLPKDADFLIIVGFDNASL